MTRPRVVRHAVAAVDGRIVVDGRPGPARVRRPRVRTEHGHGHA